MGRAWRFAMMLVGVLAACGDGVAVDEPSTAIPTSTTVVASTTSTSTTSLPATIEPILIDRRGVVWMTDEVYVSEVFFIPISFQVDEMGWVSSTAASSWLTVFHDDNGDGDSDVSINFLAYRPDAEPGEIIDEILAIDGVLPMSDRDDEATQGFDTETIDVLGEEQPDDPNSPADVPCSRPAGTARFFTSAGYPLFNYAPLSADFGIPACFRSRVWVISVAGASITAIGVVTDNDRFDELMPILEEFLQNSVMFGDADG